MGDWLREYNIADVIPFVEALEKEKERYAEYGLDMLRDAVLVPGISAKYVLRKVKNLYTPPDVEAYHFLRRARKGGSSIVFTRYAEAGVTKLEKRLAGESWDTMLTVSTLSR